MRALLIHTGLGMVLVLGVLIGLASGHFMPCYGAKRATAELVIVHIDREGREYSRRIELYGTAIECAKARTQMIMDYWQAVDSGYRSGMKAICFERV